MARTSSSRRSGSRSAKRSYDNTNQVSLWSGYFDPDKLSAPALKGKLNVDGEDKRITLWLKSPKEFVGDDRFADMCDAFAEFLELYEELCEDTGKRVPILSGVVENPEDAESKKGGSRRGGGGKPSRKAEPADDDADEDGDTW